LGEKVRSSALIWFGVIFAATVPFQVWRMAQGNAEAWLAIDYTMRVSILVLVAMVPVARVLAYRTVRLRIGLGELASWSLGVVALIVIYQPAAGVLERFIPDTALGGYPRTTGAAHAIDLSFGLLLVAVHEEVFFRRYARAAFQSFEDGAAMIVVTSIAFGLYHWWTGIPNMILAGLMGTYLMLLYRRAGALWPCIAAHYAIDFWYFW
jgi:membrane protease YdiL (CAAX protease family)